MLPFHCYTIAAINHIQPEFDLQQWGLREEVQTLHIDNLLDLCPGINGGHYWLGLGIVQGHSDVYGSDVHGGRM